MEGNIIKISRFCVDDGRGIRTTVFLKGCPLKCIWCHNPESQKKSPELWYDSSKCINCMLCIKQCETGCHSFENGKHTIDFNKCISCGKCTLVCHTGAVEMIGKNISSDALIKEIEKDMVFYNSSGGGVTISGGEPLFQCDFTSEILRRCKEKGIHTAIETCGYASEIDFKKVLSYCDFVLFDIKETDEMLHKNYTNASFVPIIKNLKMLNDTKIPFIVRMPIIPGLNDREEHFKTVKNLTENMKYCKGIDIMPYHRLGVYKYKLLKKEYNCQNVVEPDKKTIEYWKSLVK